MPYLRLYSPELSVEQKRSIARELTDGVLRALHLPEQARSWTTVHFMPFQPEDMAIGGELVLDTGQPDYHLEIVDRALSRDKKSALNRDLTPLLARLLGVPDDQRNRIHLIFRSYEPHDMAIGGRFFDEMGH